MNELTKIFAKLGENTITTMTFGEIFASLLMTLLLSLFIFYIYRKTYSGVVYSRDFNITLVIVSLVITVIMIGISRNLILSLGLVGALSIVRFRNAVKDPKDVAFIFWSISIGIVNGVQFFKLAIVASAFIGLTLILMSKRLIKRKNYVLAINSTDKITYLRLKKVISKYTKKISLRNNAFSQQENEWIFELSLDENSAQKLLKDLQKESEISTASMFTHTGVLGE